MGFPAVPVERISAKARQFDVGGLFLALLRLVGTVLVGIPYVLGWTVSKVWLGAALLGTALAEGWRDARRPAGGGRS